jgi:hypothetical protein
MFNSCFLYSKAISHKILMLVIPRLQSWLQNHTSVCYTSHLPGDGLITIPGNYFSLPFLFYPDKFINIIPPLYKPFHQDFIHF